MKLLRPHQWTKNLLCFAWAIFGGRLRETHSLWLDALVFAAFCLASSATYVLNDLRDRERDRLHPKKRFRPLASGTVNPTVAGVLSVVLATLALVLVYPLGWMTFTCVGLYLFINIVYSSGLKHSLLLDVGCIACGFVLRLLGGIYVLDDTPTAWIALCTLFLALFLGFAKRRAELSQAKEDKHLQRPVLANYTIGYLDSLLNSTAVMAVLSYAMFTTTSGKNPSLVVTVPIVYYAVMRYKHMVEVEGNGEEPEMILIKSLPIQLSIVLWLVAFVAIVYGKLHLFR